MSRGELQGELAVQVSDLLRMESLVLQTLRFRIMKPTAFSLHCLLCTILSPTQREAALAMYLTVRITPLDSESHKRKECSVAETYLDNVQV